MDFKEAFRSANDRIKVDDALIDQVKVAASRPRQKKYYIWLPAAAAAVIALTVCGTILFHQLAGPQLTLDNPPAASSASSEEKLPSKESSSEPDSTPSSMPEESIASSKPNQSKPPASSSASGHVVKPVALASPKFPTQVRTVALQADFRSGYEQFAYRSVAALLNGKNNAVCSPASLFLASAMLAESTAGSAQSQLLAMLGMDDITALRDQTDKFYRNQYLPGGTNTQLKFNQSVWIMDQYPVKKNALNTLAQKYFAESYYTPFGTKKAADQLRGWISETTGGKLNTTPAGVENPLTRLMLVNTVSYFDRWKNEFNVSHNEKAPFTLADGSKVNTEYMNSIENLDVVKGEGYTAVLLPLCDSTMRLVLPDEGVSLDTLYADPDRLAEALENTAVERRSVDLYLPRFQIEAENDLKTLLPKLGVTELFGNSKAFSPLSDNELYLGEARQRTSFTIHEKGVEAASSTYYGVAEKSPILSTPETIVLRFDRPFLFSISRDDMPLFIGTVQNPAK